MRAKAGKLTGSCNCSVEIGHSALLRSFPKAQLYPRNAVHLIPRFRFLVFRLSICATANDRYHFQVPAPAMEWVSVEHSAFINSFFWIQNKQSTRYWEYPCLWTLSLHRWHEKLMGDFIHPWCSMISSVITTHYHLRPVRLLGIPIASHEYVFSSMVISNENKNMPCELINSVSLVVSYRTYRWRKKA